MPDPFEQFEQWFQEASHREPADANAMALATVDPSGRPSIRMVLLKGISQTGLQFFTNLESRKAQGLSITPWASVCFHWKSSERQVIVEGRVETLTDEESDAYFMSRPRGSQLGAWASHQGRVLESREELISKMAEFETKFEDIAVPRPAFWGGYQLIPDRFEFWQGRSNRLHERLAFRLTQEQWLIELLSP